MTTRTLTELIQIVRERSDNEISATDNQDPFVTDDELTSYINNSIGDLWDIVVEANADQRYTSEQAFTTVLGQESYPLADDFYKLSGVDALVAAQTYSLRQFPFGERNKFKNLAGLGWLRGNLLYYRLRQDNIVFAPVPDGAYPVTIHYVPEPVQLSSGGDTVEFPNSWHLWIILDSAAKVLVKEESDPMMLMAEKSRVENRIRNAAPKRDDGNPQVVTDVYRGGTNFLL